MCGGGEMLREAALMRPLGVTKDFFFIDGWIKPLSLNIPLLYILGQVCTATVSGDHPGGQ